MARTGRGETAENSHMGQTLDRTYKGNSFESVPVGCAVSKPLTPIHLTALGKTVQDRID